MTTTREVRLKVVDGGLLAVYSDDLAGLLAQGQVTTMRASEVEPATSIGWECDGWIANMKRVGGPVLYSHETGPTRVKVPFMTRAEALSAERAYLLEHLGI